MSTPDNGSKENEDMDGLIALFVIVGCLVVLGMLADRYGADTRRPNLDDWARSVAR